MNKGKFSILFFVGIFFLLHSGLAMDPGNEPGQDILLNIIPRPFHVLRRIGFFQINPSTTLILSDKVKHSDTAIFQSCLSLIMPNGIPVGKKAISNYIRLNIDSSGVNEKEGYTLQADPSFIIITGHDAAGLFYGLQSLIQLAATGDRRIPACFIEDHPRFSYRGMHLDVCRHFFPVASIKKWINMLALYKINTFHWHLTDDQGWRIEIKSYPELQTISAYRKETLIGHKKDIPHEFDGKRYGGYYSQEEVQQIVQYAAARHISIIPEIEMPGHALAALAAFPNLGCTGGPYATATFWGIFNDVYCAGNDSTFQFIETVLNEVIRLFPSEYIHIGGDECLKEKWAVCPKCRKRMADEHLENVNELQSYFIKRIEKYLNVKGRQIIGWDEILEGGLSPGATVMSWTGEHGGIEAARLHHPVIMTPEKYVYLDYYQSLYPGEPLAGGGCLPLKKIYLYDPLPAVLTPEQTKYIIGVQANVWTEYMDSEEQAEYMMFPRMLALSEVAWSSKENRNYPLFLNRLRKQTEMLDTLHIHYARVFDEITYRVNADSRGSSYVHLFTDLPGAQIRYTTDGTKPGISSALFRDSIAIQKNELIRAAVFSQHVQSGREFEKKIFFHQAIGKKITLAFEPVENYNPGAAALVNGIEASNLYNDGQWLGFSGANLEAIIDLDSIQPVHSISAQILKYHWQRMWEPVELSFWISNDGLTYEPVYRQSKFPVNGINSVVAEFSEKRARYIKVIGINQGVIPAGEYIAGAKALLLIDEILVY